MIEGFQSRSIQSVVISEFAANREEGGDWACCKVTIRLSSADGTSPGPEVVIDIAVDISLDTPHSDIERALLQRALLVMQRCVQESAADLHLRWVETSRKAGYVTS